MSVVTSPPFDLDDSFARELTGLHQPWAAGAGRCAVAARPERGVGGRLGLDVDALRTPEGVAVLAGNAVPEGRSPWPRRMPAISSAGTRPGSVTGGRCCSASSSTTDGARRDLHLKGSGRTPFARGGDGRAAVGPMLREYLMGEAMHALGIPTTRALAVVATGESIVREVDGRHAEVPGAVLARVAASHLRVGTFQYAAATGDVDLLRTLTGYAIARHVPEAAEAELPALALYDFVVAGQADPRRASGWRSGSSTA